MAGVQVQGSAWYKCPWLFHSPSSGCASPADGQETRLAPPCTKKTQSRSCCWHNEQKYRSEGGHRRSPTCFGGHFQEVAVQVDVEVGRVVGQRDAGAVPAHSEVLLQADGAVAQHQLHRLGPGEGTGPASVVLHQYLKG